jgi:hypothetical protein
MVNRPARPAKSDLVAVAESARVIAEVCLTRLVNDGGLVLAELARLREFERTATQLTQSAAEDREALARCRELLQTWDVAVPNDNGKNDAVAAARYTTRQCAQQLAEALDPPSWDTADTLNTEQSAATGLDPALTEPDLGIVGDTASYRT